MPTRQRLVGRFLLVVVSCAALALLAVRAQAASGSQKDTPELLMQGAAESAAHNVRLTRTLTQGLAENNAYLQHLQTDKAFAAAVLAAGQKSDRAVLVTLYKRYSPTGDVTITELNPDFTYHYRKVLKTDSGDVVIEGCVSTDHGCNGGFASVTAK